MKPFLLVCVLYSAEKEKKNTTNKTKTIYETCKN